MYPIIISVIIYLGAFLYPNYLWLGVFVWMTSLVITDKNNAYGYKAGFMWGLLFFGTHLSWFAYIIAIKGHGCMRMIIYCMAVCYFALFSAFWLWLKQLLVDRWVSKFKNLKRNRVAFCCTWVISTVTFICLTCYCSLAILDCFEGYPLCSPLLPLVCWPWYLRALPYFGDWGYWIIVITINILIANLLMKFDSKTLIFLIALFGFPALFQPALYNKILHVDDIVYVQPTWNSMNLTESQTFYEISRQLDAVALRCQDAQLVVIPESGFAYNLLAWANKLDAWTSLFADDTSIFIGAHCYEGDNKFNSLYHICDGAIVGVYHKQHLMPFVERLPLLCTLIPILNGLFTQHDAVFAYPCHDQSDTIMAEFQPFICSELFCRGKKPTGDYPILFICNDSWLSLDYAKELGVRCAKLYSLRSCVSIVYVGSETLELIGC